MAEIRSLLTERAGILEVIRGFFRSRGYLEVETPILVKSPGMEPNLSPFITDYIDEKGNRQPAGLITSPEYSMKKLLGQGMEKIFTITKVFRNYEPSDREHNPEFTLLEWYQQGVDYEFGMNETQELIECVYSTMFRSRHNRLNFERGRMSDLFLQYTNINLATAQKEDFQQALKSSDFVSIETKSDTISDLFYRVFLSKIEPEIRDKNIFIYDYPLYQSSLAQLTPDRRFAERFELYLDGLELCNGFTELTDPTEQRRRFEKEAEERQVLGKDPFPIDEKLLFLLSSLRQPTFGNALGVDRLHMFVTGRSDIRDTIPFPTDSLFI